MLVHTDLEDVAEIKWAQYRPRGGILGWRRHDCTIQGYIEVAGQFKDRQPSIKKQDKLLTALI